MDKALPNQLIQAVPAIFLAAIRDPVIGYCNITCWEMLVYLCGIYQIKHNLF
jgi:hypothetical protein